MYSIMKEWFHIEDFLYHELLKPITRQGVLYGVKQCEVYGTEGYDVSRRTSHTWSFAALHLQPENRCCHTEKSLVTFFTQKKILDFI